MIDRCQLDARATNERGPSRSKASWRVSRGEMNSILRSRGGQLFVLVLISFWPGCGRRENGAKSGAELFAESTGVALPKNAKVTNEKTIDVAFVGGTHYLKLDAKQGFSEFLDANFDSSNWEVAQLLLSPPKEWMRDLPFWDEKAVANASHYYARTHKSRGIIYATAISYSRPSGIAYLVASECRD